MKKSTFFFIITLLFFCLNVNAQVKETKYVYETVISNQNFELNSYLKTGGRSRSFIKITLPQNTVHWFYMITIKKLEQPYSVLDLSNQIATKIKDPQFQAANLAANLFLAPDGTATCDVFLTNKKGKDLFMERTELNLDYVYSNVDHEEASSRLNFSQGTIKINNSNTSNYLVFRNNSPMQGIKVSIEVVAKVKKTEVNWQEWSIEGKKSLNDFYSEYFEDYGYGEKTNQWIAQCVSETIFKNCPPKLYYSEEMKKITPSIIEHCEKPYKQGKLDKENATRYSDLSNDMLDESKIDECIKYSQQALSLNSSLISPYINLSICFLVQENQEKAQLYLENYMRKMQSSTFAKQEKINYLQNLKQRYRMMESKYGHIDTSTIMHMINNEIEKYKKQ
jgi:hypothetical protein